MSEILRLSNRRHDRRRVYFDRSELSLLLALYSDRVARGEWKDYAIDHADGIAWFSIFRHSSSGPAYAIAKECDPRGHRYAVFDHRGRIKRAAALREALTIFRAKPTLVSD